MSPAQARSRQQAVWSAYLGTHWSARTARLSPIPAEWLGWLGHAAGVEGHRIVMTMESCSACQE